MDHIQINPADRYACDCFTSSTGSTILMYLVRNTREHPEYLEQIKYILDNYPEELDKRNIYGFTALMFACINTNTSTLETIELLLKYNPDLYLEDTSNQTVLFLTLTININLSDYDTKIIQLLLDHGLDINITDTNGCHIIVDMIRCRNYETIKYFLEKTSIDLYYKDKNNKCVYEYLLSCNNSRIIELTKNYMDNSLDVKSALD